MKTHMKILALCAVVVLTTLAACRKDQQPAGTTAIKSLLTQLQTSPQTFTVNAGSYQTITGAKGTLIRIQANSLLHQNGQPVTGSVTFTLKEMYSPADMIRNNATTTSNGRPLISSGEIFLSASQNGEELRINSQSPLSITFPSVDGTFDAQMQLFTGNMILADSIAQDSILNWDTAGQAAAFDTIGGGGGTMGGIGYSFVSDSFGWSNCDRFWSWPQGSGTAVLIQSQEGFDNTNTAVYMVFNAENSAAPADMYYEDDNQFGFHSDGNTPLGLSVTIIAVAEKDGQNYISIVNTTTTQGMVVQLDMQPHTMADILAMISAI